MLEIIEKLIDEALRKAVEAREAYFRELTNWDISDKHEAMLDDLYTEKIRRDWYLYGLQDAKLKIEQHKEEEW